MRPRPWRQVLEYGCPAQTWTLPALDKRPWQHADLFLRQDHLSQSGIMAEHLLLIHCNLGIPFYQPHPRTPIKRLTVLVRP